MTSRTPLQIVNELNRFVVGQHDAKRAIAVALRSRWRRKYLTPEMMEEIKPHNILMIGPTGVGKTEIARRIAKITDSPFIKIESTKFTEVGYVGRDVESIIRDLVEIAVRKTKKKFKEKVEKEAKKLALKRLISALAGEAVSTESKEYFKNKILSGEIDLDIVEIELNDQVSQNQGGFGGMDIPGIQVGVINFAEMLGKNINKKTKIYKTTVKDAYQKLINEESENMIDENEIHLNSVKDVEENGIVFLDEIDKIASKGGTAPGRGEVSREGVQRDLLPLIEGTVVTTKYGQIKTDYILFIASGAFQLSKPSDLLPELQGRLPVRVELNQLTAEDLKHILTVPEYNLPKQYEALLKVEGVKIEFTEDGIDEIANISTEMNSKIENVGARRLHTVMEKLLEDISFRAPEMSGAQIFIDRKLVQSTLSKFNEDFNIKNFIL